MDNVEAFEQMLSQGGSTPRKELKKLREICEGYFVEERIMNFVEKILKDYRIQKGILNLLGLATNRSVKNLFKVKLK